MSARRESRKHSYRGRKSRLLVGRESIDTTSQVDECTSGRRRGSLAAVQERQKWYMRTPAISLDALLSEETFSMKVTQLRRVSCLYNSVQCITNSSPIQILKLFRSRLSLCHNLAKEHLLSSYCHLSRDWSNPEPFDSFSQSAYSSCTSRSSLTRC